MEPNGSLFYSTLDHYGGRVCGFASQLREEKSSGVAMIFRRALIYLVILALVGCGGSPESGPGTQALGPTTATLTLRLSDSVAKTLDGSVNKIRLKGLDGSGDTVFGPVLEERRVELSWEIPVSVKRLVLEFLSDDSVVGIYSVTVALQPGQNLVIEDPDFLDAASPLVSLRIQSVGTVFPVDFYPRLTVLGTFEDASTADLTESAAWSVAESQVADIDSTGLLSPKVAGRGTVRAEVLDVSDELVLTISDARLSNVRIDPDAFQIAAATGTFLTALGDFSDGTLLELKDGVTWSSNLQAIATVDEQGKVIGQMPGSAQIRASYKGQTGTSTATISSATLSELTVTPTGTTVPVGETSPFRAQGRFSDATTQDLTQFVTWGSSNAMVASVNSQGMANGVGPGQALIIATDLEETMMASGTLTVTATPNAPPVATTLVFDGVPTTVGHGTTLSPVTVSVLDQFGQPLPSASCTVVLSLLDPPEIAGLEPAILGQNTGSGDTGSGSGEPTGSSSGEPTGSGSGEPTGSGSGEPTGSGSGIPPNPDTGPNGETGLVGTLSKPLVNGKATFDDLIIYTAGTYVLRAELGGVQGTSNIFTVTFP